MAEVPFHCHEPKDKEPMEIADNLFQQHHVHQHQTSLFPQQLSSISLQDLNEQRRITLAHIQEVQNLIERCLQLYMDQSQVVTTLHDLARIEPAFTILIWKKIEEQNPAFFKEYYMRLKLKNQIAEFNHLLEQQARMVQLMQGPPRPVGNAHMGHPTPPSPPMQHFRYIPQASHSQFMDRNRIINEHGGRHGPRGMLLGSFSHAYTGPMGMGMGMGMDGTQNRIGDLPVDVPSTGGMSPSDSLEALGQMALNAYPGPMGMDGIGDLPMDVPNTGGMSHSASIEARGQMTQNANMGPMGMTTPTTSMGMDHGTENRTGDLPMKGMSRSASLEDLGQMTQNFSFPDLAAYFASGAVGQSDSSGQISRSFSFSELTAFTSGGSSRSESAGLIPKNYSFSELAEVFAPSDERHNNAGDVNMELLGSLGDLSTLAREAPSNELNINAGDVNMGLLGSNELNNNPGDVDMGLLGSFGDLSILAPEALLQSPDRDDNSLVENIYGL